MMHVVYGSKSVLMGDDAATGLLEYAAVLGTHGIADVVNVVGISRDGNEVSVALLLNGSSGLAVESTNSQLNPPPNTKAVAYMQERLTVIRNPPQAITDSEPNEPDLYDDEI